MTRSANEPDGTDSQSGGKMSFKRKVQEALGETYRFALFYNFPSGLRFELSEGGSPFDQVLLALRKATAISTDVFSGQEQILVHFQYFAEASPFELRRTLRELKIAGIVFPRIKDIWSERTDADDDYGEGAWVNCAFEAPVAKLQNLLWCAVATDFRSIRPNPRCKIYLVNSDMGIVVHPYDDRGMDVVSRHPSALEGLYKQHYDLLLDYDMDVMQETFGE